MDLNLLAIYNQIDIKCTTVNEIDSQLSALKDPNDPKREALLAQRRKKYAEYLKLKDELHEYLHNN